MCSTGHLECTENCKRNVKPRNFCAREQSLLILVGFAIAFHAFHMFYAHARTTEIVLHVVTFRRVERIKTRRQEPELDARRRQGRRVAGRPGGLRGRVTACELQPQPCGTPRLKCLGNKNSHFAAPCGSFYLFFLRRKTKCFVQLLLLVHPADGLEDGGVPTGHRSREPTDGAEGGEPLGNAGQGQLYPGAL